MALAIYADHHVASYIIRGLRLRSVDVVTAFEDGAYELADPLLLDRATALGRVLFTRDKDFLIEAKRRQRVGTAFSGIIYAHQRRVPIGKCIDDLEIVAKTGETRDLNNSVLFLPL